MSLKRSSATVHVAISGCGAVAELYYAPTLRALTRERRVEVVALFDPERERRETLGTRFPRALCCNSLTEVLETRPGLLIVASPPRFHAEQAIEALSAGIDVLCEKPLTITVADARRMVEAEKRHGRLLAVGMVRRRMPAARMIHSALAGEMLGRLESFEVFEGGPFQWPVHGPGYFDARHSGGGVLVDLGAHVLDLLTWWLGAPSDVVAADDAMGGVEANVRMTLACGGVPGTIRLSRDWERPNHMTIRGAEGVLRWSLADTDRVTLTRADGEPSALHAPAETRATFLDCFRTQLEAVLNAVAGKTSDVVHAADVVPSIEAVETAYASTSLLQMPWLTSRERDAALRARSS